MIKDHIKHDEELAQRLDAQLQAEMEKEDRLARQREEEDNIVSWDNAQAMMEADYQMAERLHAREQALLTDEEKATLRAQEIRYKQNQLRHKSFDDIQKLFDKALKRVNTFVPMDTEKVEGSKAKAAGSKTRVEESSKRAGEELDRESTKKQKVEDETEQAELKECFEIIPFDEDAVNTIPLATKQAPIRNLEVLYKIVKDMFKSTKPVGDNRVLWGILMTMFEPSAGDEMWREQWRYLIKSWKLIDSCGNVGREAKFDYECEMAFELLRRQKQVLKTENPGKRIAFLENEHSKSFAKCLRKEAKACMLAKAEASKASSKAKVEACKYVPVCKKHKPNMYCHVPVTGSMLGLPNFTTWDEIEKKMGAKKSKTYVDKAKGKRKVSCGS
ncbi:hypothetical protein Tco_1284784 [Tanacetum coccineum]